MKLSWNQVSVSSIDSGSRPNAARCVSTNSRFSAFLSALRFRESVSMPAAVIRRPSRRFSHAAMSSARPDIAPVSCELSTRSRSTSYFFASSTR